MYKSTAARITPPTPPPPTQKKGSEREREGRNTEEGRKIHESKESNKLKSYQESKNPNNGNPSTHQLKVDFKVQLKNHLARRREESESERERV